MGLDVRFVEIPSFEGMYLSEEKMILLSGVRPEGRKRFTCAHEIGHHILGHGNSIDEIAANGSNSSEEDEADWFASVLLMPSSGVMRIINEMNITPTNLTSANTYILSKYLNVSYKALLNHLFYNIKFIGLAQYRSLFDVQVKAIKNGLGARIGGDIVIVDKWWQGRAIDLNIGDRVVFKHSDEVMIEGANLSKVDGPGNAFEAKATGIGKVSTNNWSSFIRISKPAYIGMLQYMYEEEE